MIQIKHRVTRNIILTIDAQGFTGTNLSGIDLSGADLSDADLSWINLSGANLSGANLRLADLNYTNLSGANLEGANIDYSCLDFSCKSRTAKTDRRQRVQLAHHLLSWMKYADNLNEDEKQIFEQLKLYANEFHINSVEKF